MVDTGSGGLAAEALAARVQELADAHRGLSDHLWSLTMESGLTADFFRETLSANAVNLEATRSIDGEIASLEASAKAISASAAGASAKLGSADEASRASLAAIEKGGDALSRMDRSFSGFMAIFGRLAEAVDRIEGTLRSIDEISELTNLLSLNAAIEAARAGVHGKGFKVVANEVKSLAEKSKGLTNEAAGILKELRIGMGDAQGGLKSIESCKTELDERIVSSRKEQGRSTGLMDGASGNMREIQESLLAQDRSSGHIAASMSSLAKAADLLTESSALIQGNLQRQTSSADEVLKSSGRLKGRIIELDRSIRGASCADGATIPIGHDVTYPPWVHIAKGHSAGITIELARAFAQSRGLKPEFRPSQFALALDELYTGSIRVLANVGWPNAFFDGKPVIPTQPYAAFKPAVFAHVSRTAEFTNMAALKGKRVAAQRGSYVNDCLKGAGCETLIVENDLEAFAAVIWRRVDCAITERLVGSYLSDSYFSGVVASCFEVGEEKNVVFLLRSSDAELKNSMDEWIRNRETKALVDRLVARNLGTR